MKKFKFRFQAVEKLRKIELDNEVKEFAKAQRRATELEAQLNELREELTAEVERLKNAGDANFLNLDVWALSQDYRETKRRQIGSARQEHQKSLVEVESARNRLIGKQKRKRAIERLHEREEEKYHEELSKKENLEFDEMAARVLIFRRGPSGRS